MDEKRLQASEKESSWGEGGLGVIMGLLLIVGALLSVGGASRNSSKPVETMSGSLSTVSSASARGSDSAETTGYAEADRDVLDLQLD